MKSVTQLGERMKTEGKYHQTTKLPFKELYDANDERYGLNEAQMMYS